MKTSSLLFEFPFSGKNRNCKEDKKKIWPMYRCQGNLRLFMVVCSSYELLNCSLFKSVNSALALLTTEGERARRGIYQRLEPVRK